jgi:hypothetical protein
VGDRDADDCEEDDDEASLGVPVFHDLVKRSTRFSTSVPAAEVLKHIAQIVEDNPHPMQVSKACEGRSCGDVTIW